ncbi:MAG: SIS domain-containing protein [Anaerolineaceae bacterium]|nr:SIS domain-containing protein [Anaerolineaceae bacterium]
MPADTQLHKEIFEQPQVIQTLLDAERQSINRLAAAIHARQINHVIIAARGTSDNAARYAQYLLGSVNRMVVTLATPSLFTLYHQPPLFGNALVIGISQSGKSPDIVAVLEEARRQSVLTAAITNVTDSELAQQADHIISLNAGKERSVAATKTYTAELTAIAMLANALTHDPVRQKELEQIPHAVAKTLEMEPVVAQAAPRYRYMRAAVVIGRGYNYATAFETALKLKELTYTIVESYSSADFLHGPLAIIEHGFPAITIAPSGRVLPEMRSFIETIKKHQAEVAVISDDAETLHLADVALPLPLSVPEWLSPITSIIPGQLLAMHLASIRHYDPDKPRSLSKVTETY